MTHTTVPSFLLLLALSASAHAQESRCPAISSIEKDDDGRSTCRCGADLKNVTLTPPKGLQLQAACRLRQTEGFIPIPKTQPINLNQYDSRGNSHDGNYYFRGRLRMTGVVRFEPSDGGDVFFWPKVPTGFPKSTIEPSFRMFHLVPEGQYATYFINKKVLAMECAEAVAEVVVKEVRVEVNASEEAGAYPVKLDLLWSSPYKPCKRK